MSENTVQIVEHLENATDSFKLLLSIQSHFLSPVASDDVLTFLHSLFLLAL